MTCPSCGASIQPHDLFCINCGRQMTPADPTRHLDASPSGEQADSAYGDYAAPSYQADPASSFDPYAPLAQEPYTQPYPHSAQEPYTQPAPQSYTQPAPQSYVRPALVDEQPPANQSWASGSSFPSPNPYAPSQPNTVSRGTILNGQPIGAGGGILKGIGAAGVALLIALKSFGGAIAGLGFFKLFFLLQIFRWLAFGHSWLLILIVLLIVGAIWRSQTA